MGLEDQGEAGRHDDEPQHQLQQMGQVLVHVSQGIEADDDSRGQPNQQHGEAASVHLLQMSVEGGAAVDHHHQTDNPGGKGDGGDVEGGYGAHDDQSQGKAAESLSETPQRHEAKKDEGMQKLWLVIHVVSDQYQWIVGKMTFILPVRFAEDDKPSSSRSRSAQLGDAECDPLRQV